MNESAIRPNEAERRLKTEIPPLLRRSSKTVTQLIGIAALTMAFSTSAFSDDQLQSPQNPESKTLGFVLTWFGMGNQEGEDDCPDGVAEFPDQKAFLAAQTEERRAELTDPKNRGGVLMAMAERGPSGVNVCEHPDTVVEPPLRTVQGDTAFGLNLTGTDGSEDEPPNNTCPHKKFKNGLNGEDNVDNQWYRVTGCTFGYRNDSPGGYITQFTSGVMLDGNYTILIEVTDVDDVKNDDDVTIGLYMSDDVIVRDAKGSGVLPYASLQVTDDKRYHNILKGKIEDGEIIVTEAKDIFIYARAGAATPPEYHIRDGRLRLAVNDDGTAEGVIAGYMDWLVNYRQASRGSSFAETQVGMTCPSLYKAYKELADGYPDPVTGECTAISSAFYIKAKPAFVIHPEQDDKDRSEHSEVEEKKLQKTVSVD